MIDDFNHPDSFKRLSSDEQKALADWISRNLISRKTANHRHSSYGLKHLFEHSDNGLYVTNGAFKGAMLACGFKPDNEHELNWVFGISEKSPAIKEGRWVQ